MWRPVVVKTPPAAEPVLLDDAKAHLRVEHNDDDPLIGTIISAARAHVESVTGQKLSPQTLTLRTDRWADLTRLPVAPVQSVTVSYTDVAGVVRELADEAYNACLDGLEPGIVPSPGATWAAIQPGSFISVEAVAGYEGGKAPPEMMAAVKLIVGDLYAFRETGQVGSVSSDIKTSATVEALLTNHRIYLV